MRVASTCRSPCAHSGVYGTVFGNGALATGACTLVITSPEVAKVLARAGAFWSFWSQPSYLTHEIRGCGVFTAQCLGQFWRTQTSDSATPTRQERSAAKRKPCTLCQRPVDLTGPWHMHCIFDLIFFHRSVHSSGPGSKAEFVAGLELSVLIVGEFRGLGMLQS